MSDDLAVETHVPKRGEADLLEVRERVLPPPGPDEVRVRIEAAGVAYAAIIMRRGCWSTVRREAWEAGSSTWLASRAYAPSAPRRRASGRRWSPAALRSLLLRGRISSWWLFNQSKGAVGYSVVKWRDGRPQTYRADLSRVLQLVADGAVSPLVAATFPLREAAEAQRQLESRSVAGKIVLVT